MDYLNQEAAIDYLLLTEVEYTNWLIPEEEYIERLEILLHLTDRQANQLRRVIIANASRRKSIDEPENYFWNIDIPETEGRVIQNHEVNEFHGGDFNPVLHFITSFSGKISKWEFHKTDTDSFPSIPHGHAIINHKIKLDAYRGYIFRNNLLYDREAKEFIVKLWNDSSFRKAAKETINFFMQMFPKYHWRVPNPTRLPRKRR